MGTVTKGARPNLRKELGWDVKLKFRHGARERLEGIRVYHEFEWLKYCPDQRTQFRNGKALARQAIADCPDGKIAALLLVDRDDVEERARVTPNFYIVVVNLRRYLAMASADAAVSYLASDLGPITQASNLKELAGAAPAAVNALLHAQLTLADVVEWAEGDDDRLSDLHTALASPDDEFVAAVLRGATSVNGDIVAAIAELVQGKADHAEKLDLIRAVLEDGASRRVAGEVLSERLEDRLRDARRAVTEYTALLDDPASKETDLQAYLERKPWILGLEYARVLPKQPLPRGAADFLLARFDGFYDLLELKDPSDPIIVAPQSGDMPPSPSKITLSKSLAQALAQVHLYRDIMRHETMTEQSYGLPETRDPHVIIILGKSSSLTDLRRRILHELNCSLHRVEVLPYDIVGTRAEAMLQAVEEQITKAGST